MLFSLRKSSNPALLTDAVAHFPRYLFLLAAASLLWGCPAPATTGNFEEFATIRARMFPDALAYGSERTSVDDLRQKLNKDGSWRDTLSYRHILERRLLFMAQAYTADSAYAGDEQLKEEYYRALRWWLDNPYGQSVGSWKAGQIDVPMKAGYQAILMYAAFEKDMVDRQRPMIRELWTQLMDYLANAKPTSVSSNKGEFVLGANLSFRLNPLQARAACLNSPSEMDEVYKIMEQTMEIGIGEGKQGFSGIPWSGLTPDWSWHQHNFDHAQTYWLAYGGRWLQYTSLFGGYNAETSWALKPEHWQRMERAVIEGHQWCFYRTRGAYNLAGRFGLGRDHFQLRGITHKKYIQLLYDHGGKDLRAPDTLARIMVRLENPNATPLSGIRHFWNSDLLIQSRAGHYISIKMLSNRTMGPELGNGVDLKSFYMGDGSAIILKRGDEYQKARVGWDVTGIPGTTTERTTVGMPLRSSSVYGYLRSVNSFAGAVVDGRHGAAAFDHHRFYTDFMKVRSRKGYFLFEDEWIFLGAGISREGPPDQPVFTTLNQCEWTTPISYSSGDGILTIPRGSDFVREITITKPAWVYQDGIGYVILPEGPTTLSIRAEQREGDWQDLDATEESYSQTVDVFQLSINHGRTPVDGSYRYIILPEISLKEMPSLISSLDVAILSNSPQLMAVEHKGLHKLQAAVFSDSQSIRASSGLELDIATPCMLMTEEFPGSLSISVSDPNQNPELTDVLLTVNRRLDGPGAKWDEAKGVTKLSLALPSGTERGKTIAYAFRMGPGYAPDVVISSSVTSGEFPLSVAFDGGGSSSANGEIERYVWRFGDGDTAIGAKAYHRYEEIGNYWARLELTDGRGARALDSVEIVVMPGPCAGLSGVKSLDIGPVQKKGGSCMYEDSLYMLRASGADIWGERDEFHFACVPLEGDGEIIARIRYVEPTHGFARLGVMMRGTLEPGSAHALAYISADGIWSFQWRPAADEESESTRSEAGAVAFPYWVRLERKGDAFLGYRSPDGENWILMDQMTIPMDHKIWVGLAACSHEPGLLTTTLADRVSLQSSASQGKAMDLSTFDLR